MTAVDMSDPRAVAFYTEIEVTPELAAKWEDWKSDYVVGCMTSWIDQGADRDDALKMGACVMAELIEIDALPWMPLGEAIGIKIESALAPGDTPWQGQKRIDFIRHCRTLDLCNPDDYYLAAAYQMGTSVGQFMSRVVDTPGSAREECALYRHFDRNGALLYVGIAEDPKVRAGQHRANSPWFKFSTQMTVEWFDTRDEAHAAERDVIADERPVFNGTHNSRNRKAAIDYLFAALDGATS